MRGVNTKANGIDFRANRFDEFLKLIPQNLSDAEKAQVMANLGITPTPGSLDGAVRYDAAQTLTDAQKQKALGNIGATKSISDIQDIKSYGSDVFDIVGYVRPSGQVNTSSGWHRTDYIEIDKVYKIHTEKLEYNNSYVGVIAFYDNNKTFISALSELGAGLNSYDVEINDIPTNAAYAIFTSRDSVTTTEQIVKIQVVAETIDILKERIDGQTSSIQTANTNATKALNRTNTTKTEYGLDDAEWYSNSYSRRGLAQYILPQSQDIYFDTIVVRNCDLLDNASVEYKVCIVTPYGQAPDYIPLRYNASVPTSAIIKEGTLTSLGSGYKDYKIDLEDVVNLPAGKEVVVFLLGDTPIRFKSDSTWSSTEPFTRFLGIDEYNWNSVWNPGYASTSLHLINQSLFLSRTERESIKGEIIDEIEPLITEQVDESIASGLEIVIPDLVYAIEGTELNIWNDTISLSVDKGLQSPMNYQVRWDCNKGLVIERGFRFTPTSSDVGDVPCTCYIYDVRGKLITSKTFTIRVKSKSALSSAKKIAYFGDSLGASVANNLYANFNDSSLFSGTIPTMVGTMGSAPKYDAVGGYSWVHYATAGEDVYRASVSGVTSLSVGAKYLDAAGKGFGIIEVNITEGAGNILIARWYSQIYPYGELQMPSGTLTKISGGGDDTISYTEAYIESRNPLWNENTSKLDVALYKTRCGLQSTDLIDAVSFQLGCNDSRIIDTPNILKGYIKDIYDAFIADNAECLFIIGLVTTAGNTLDGAGSNYGANWNYKQQQDNWYRMRKFYIGLLSDTTMPNLRIATPNLSIDRYYGFSFGTRVISSRCSQTEQYHVNYAHPATSGYQQMADAYLAAFVGALTEI